LGRRVDELDPVAVRYLGDQGVDDRQLGQYRRDQRRGSDHVFEPALVSEHCGQRIHCRAVESPRVCRDGDEPVGLVRIEGGTVLGDQPAEFAASGQRVVDAGGRLR